MPGWFSIGCLTNNLDLVRRSPIVNSFGNSISNLIENKGVSLCKRGESTSLRGDMADLNYFGSSGSGSRAAKNYRSSNCRCAERFDQVATAPQSIRGVGGAHASGEWGYVRS